eukprot:gene1361-11443_t
MEEGKQLKILSYSTWNDDKHVHVSQKNDDMFKYSDKFYQQSNSISFNNHFIYGLRSTDIIQLDTRNDLIKCINITIDFKFTKHSIEETLEKEKHLFQYDTENEVMVFQQKLEDFNIEKGETILISNDKIFVFGGVDDENTLNENIFEFSIYTRKWSNVGFMKLRNPLYNHSVYHYNDQYFIHQYIDEKTSKIFYSQSDQHWNFTESIIFENLKNEKFETLKSVWEEKQLVLKDLKNELIEKLIHQEFHIFFKNPTEDVIAGTLFLQHARKILNDFPLYKTKNTGKNQHHSIDEFIFLIPEMIPEIDKSFKSEFTESIRSSLIMLYCQLIQIPNEKNIKIQIKEQFESLKSEKISSEDKTIIEAILKIDYPIDFYNILKETKSIEELPYRYQNLLGLIKERAIEFLKMDSFSDDLFDKLKWLNRVLYILYPFVRTLNPFSFIEKLIDHVIFSRIGKTGIIMMLDVTKTEKMIEHQFEVLNNPKYTRLVNSLSMKEIQEMVKMNKNENKEFQNINFQQFLIEKMNKNIENIDQLQLYFEAISLKNRLFEKKNLIALLEDKQVERLLKKTLKISLLAFANVYSSADITTILNLIHHVISKLLASSNQLKYLSQHKKQEEWNAKVRSLIQESEKEVYILYLF